MNKCRYCKWYHWEDSIWGHCRRFPPKAELKKVFPKIKYKMEYPEVIAEKDYCGEFKNKQHNY